MGRLGRRLPVVALPWTGLRDLTDAGSVDVPAMTPGLHREHGAAVRVVNLDSDNTIPKSLDGPDRQRLGRKASKPLHRRQRSGTDALIVQVFFVVEAGRPGSLSKA